MTCDREKLNNLVGFVSLMVSFFGMRMRICIEIIKVVLKIFSQFRT